MTSILVNFLVGIKKIDTISINDKILKGLRRLQNYFPHKVVLGMLKIFFLFEKKVLFSSYLDFCIFVKSADLKICDITIGIAT